MTTIDLDVDNYNTKELLGLLDFNDNVPHNIEELNEKYEAKAHVISGSETLSTIKKHKMIDFFKDIKDRLVDNLFKTRPVIEQSQETPRPPPIEPIKHAELVHNVEYTPGKLNPIGKQTLKTIVEIDTKFRPKYDTTNSANFAVQLPNAINHVVSIKLVSFKMPNAIYTFSDHDKSNEFTITCRGVNKLIKVPEGNYTGEELVGLLNSASYLGQSPINNYAVAHYNKNNGKFSFYASTSPDFSNSNTYFSLDFGVEGQFRSLYMNMGWRLGFRQQEYEVMKKDLFIDVSITSKGYISEGLYDENKCKEIYFVLNDFKYNTNRGFTTVFNEHISKANILTKIQQDKCETRILEHERVYLGPQQIDKLQIQLIDEHERIVKLNSMNFVFALEFEYLYT